MSFLLGLFFFGGLIKANAITLYGVTTTNQLVRFDSATPGTVITVGAITGIQGGETILGIDFRPATGQLYALGNASRLYTINTATGAATFASTLSIPLNGTSFGVDFNPVPDRLRVTSDTKQNLRINVDTGAVIVDGTLNSPSGTPPDPTIGASAYTNSFAGATTTTLYNIDYFRDRLTIQTPPNDGTQTAVGALGVDASAVVGFDITAATGIGYAALNVGGISGLYTINLTTGAATLVGAVGGGVSLTGIAVEIGSIRGLTVFGLTTSNSLVRFNSARPNTLLAKVGISGLQTGENLIGIDVRPSNGLLYATGNTGRIYTINTATGAATFVVQMSVAPSGTNFGYDFNPVPDRLRIVSDTDQNLRANVMDGVTLVDGTLAYQAGDPNFGQNPNIVAAGYTNNFAGTTTTALRVIDSNLDIIATQIDPNGGVLQTAGSLGVNTTANVGYDFAGATSIPVLSLQVGSDTTSKLFTVMATGGFVRAAFIAPIGGTEPLRGIAVAGGGGTASRNILDFGGDSRADFSVFRFSNGFVFISRPDGSAFGFPFGIAGDDKFTPGDYDGDGRTDLAVFRNSTGVFYVQRSSDNTVTGFQFGSPGDEPVARDYDGDGRTDFAVVRRTGNTTGALTWFINNSSDGSFRAAQFGIASDAVAPGDYDGDGRFDLAVFRGSGDQPATFFVQRSLLGFTAVQFGIGSDLVVPGDYDGDGRTDFAVVRDGTNYQWYILRSSDNAVQFDQLGTKSFLTVQNDYDGDGRTDVAVYDPNTGFFSIRRSSNGGLTQFKFGQLGDFPIANYDTH
ncbi:MAG: DUF4394 domain-containing protein [Pyrinomonadaceae bacterium]|nr:DUF4394 domain-containing protein [Pyrinomonadaceae bacterium]